MSISVAQENTGSPVYGTNVSSFNVTPSNVTAGNLFVFGMSIYSDPPLTPTAGMLTKTGGTSTIGTITRDVVQVATAQQEFRAVIYSFLVTGSGSLTLTWNGGQSGSYGMVGYGEYASDIGWDDSRLEASNSATGNSTAPDSGNATSAGEALFFGVLGDARNVTRTTTPDAAWTQICENENPSVNQAGSVIRRITTTALTDSASWTISSNHPWAAVVAVYKESSGGGGGGDIGGKSHIDGVAASGISHIDGVAVAGISAITRIASGFKRHIDGRLLVPAWPSLLKV